MQFMDSHDSTEIDSSLKDQNNENAEEQVFRSQLAVSLKKSITSEKSVSFNSGCEGFNKLREKFLLLEKQHSIETDQSRVLSKKTKSVDNRSLKLNFLNDCVDNNQQGNFSYEKDNLPVNNINSVVVDDEELVKSTKQTELLSVENKVSETEEKTRNVKHLTIDTDSASKEREDNCKREQVISPEEKSRKIVKTIEHLVDNVPIFKDLLREFSEEDNKKYNEVKTTSNFLEETSKDEQEVDFFDENVKRYNYNKSKENTSSLSSTSSSLDDDDNDNFIPKIVENPGSAKPLKSILKKSSQNNSPELCAKFPVPKKVLTIEDNKKYVTDENSSVESSDIVLSIASAKLDKIVEDITDSNEPENNSAKDRLNESQLKIEKLQQSLPTKLNTSTVESLKSKYSPTNFDYPKSFIKNDETDSSQFNSKIPLFSFTKKSSIKTTQDSIPTIINETKITDEEVPLVTDKTDLKRTACQSFKGESGKEYEVKTVIEHRSFETETIAKPNISDNNNNTSEECSKSDGLNENTILDDSIKDNKSNIEERKLSNEGSVDNKTNLIDTEQSEEKTKIDEENSTSIQKNEEVSNVKSDSAENVQSDKEDSLSSSKSLNSDNVEITNEKNKNSDSDSDYGILVSNELRQKEIADGYAELVKSLNMNENKKSSKKRTSSFRKLLPSLFGSSKDKNKTSSTEKNSKLVRDINGQKKSENSFLSENFQNEVHHFERNSVERHTLSHYPVRDDSNSRHMHANENSSEQDFFQFPNVEGSDQNGTKVVRIQNRYQRPVETDTYSIPVDTCDNFDERLCMRNNNGVVQQQDFHTDEYVCMGNGSQGRTNQQNIDKKKLQYMNIEDVNKYIDTSTSSSNSTLISEHNLSGWENPIQRRPHNARHINRNELIKSPLSMSDYSNRNRFIEKPFISTNDTQMYVNNPETFNEDSLNTGPNNFDPQLIKPKAIIPITTERPLPNPYHNVRDISYETKNKTLFSPEEEKQELLHPTQNAESHYNNHDTKKDDSLIYDLLAEAVSSSTPKNEMDTKEARAFPNTSKQIDRNLQKYSETTTPNKSTNSNNEHIHQNEDIFYQGYTPTKSQYETVYGNIRKNTTENTSSSSDPYKHLVPVSAEVKITRHPVINTKKSLRARSLSPEQRYKLDIPKQVQRSNQLESREFYNMTQQQSLQNPNQNDYINRNNTLGELVEIRTGNTNTTSKVLNSQHTSKKSPKNERKSLKKSMSDVGKKSKVKNDTSTHQKLEIELDYPENFNQSQREKVSPQKDVYLNRKDRPVAIEHKMLMKNEIRQSDNRGLDACRLPVRKDSRPCSENRTQIITSSPRKERQLIQNDHVVDLEIQNAELEKKYTRQLNDHTNSREFCSKDALKVTGNFDKHDEQNVEINSSQMKQIQQEDMLRTKLKPITSGEMSKIEAQFNPRVHSPSATNVTHRNFNSPVNIDTSSPIIMSTKSPNSSPSPRQYKNPPLSPQHLQNLRNVEMWANKQKEQPGMNCPAYKQPPSKSNSYSKNGSITTKAVVHHNPNSALNSQSMTYTNVPIQRGHVPPSGRPAQFSDARHMNSSPSLQKQQLSLQNMQYMEMSYWQMIKEKRDREEYEVRYKQQVLRQRDDMNLSAEHRSRASGGFVRNGRRSASLPRSITYTAPIGSSHHDYFARHADKIPEYPPNEKNPNTLIASHEKLNQKSHTDYGYLRQRGQEVAPVLKTNNNNNFVRGSGQRSTIGPINTQKSAPSPIAEDIIYENFFPDVQLRYQCQPIRRDSRQMPIFKRGSLNEQSVQQDNEGLQLKKVSFSGTSNTNMPSGDVWPTKNGYVQSPPTRRNRGPSVISMGDDSVFIEPENDNSNVSKHVSRCLVEPQYGKTAHKQVTVTDKVCDFYGKIHDTSEKRVVTPPSNYGHIQKSGVIYGELKRKSNPIAHGYTNNPYTANDIENVKKLNNCEPIRMNNQSDTHSTRKHEHIENSRLIDTRNTQFFHSPAQQFSRKPDSSGLKYPQDRSTSAPLMQNVTNKWPDTGNRAQEAPNRPLPPIPRDNKRMDNIPRASNYVYGDGRVGVRSMSRPSNTPESESGSEAGEVQRILSNIAVLPQYQQQYNYMLSAQKEEEWNADGKSRGPPGSDSGGGGGGNADVGELRGGGPRGSRSTRREDPRRHTLSGDQHLYPPGPGQGGVLTRTMDLEGNLPRGYPPPSNAMLFDDDPGIMSEVETSSTGFRRGGKQRSSLPVVRTPSKTLERPLGLVFLQYRNETKRALLPNEITSIDTVKALFVRSFPKQLTMEYLDSPLVKIYIHDSSKDMFYELEDLRSHLRDIRDRSVLRLFESTDVTGGLPGPGTGITGGVGHFEDQSYFSEPEFDSEYQHQHIHKSKTSGKNAPPYYMGSATTLPRGGPLLRAYSPAVGAPVPADRIKSITGPTGTNSAPPKPVRAGTYPAGAGSLRGAPPGRYAPFLSPAELRHAPDSGLYSLPDRIHSDGYMSSPERGSRGQYEDPYYSQYAPRSGSMTPVIDEEASDTELLDESYSLYGVKLPPGGPRAVPAPRSQFPVPAAVPYDATRIRVEHMERQLANLTGLVQKALTQTPNERPTTRDFLQVPAGRENFRADKSVSFEKSVSFSDEPPDMNSPKQHSPQHAERDRLKPAPPPKPAALAAVQYESTRHIYRDLQLTPEMYNQLRGLQKKAKDLRAEVRNLRRMSQAQAHSVRETIRDTFIKIRSMLIVGGEQAWQAGVDQEKIRLSREEDLYKQEMLRLEKDLTDLESTVEELRGNVINRKTRVNMSDVENMALILSKSSKTVADLKVRFPGLQEGLKSMLTSEMDKVVREEKFLKEEPDRLESALRRCKKLTGTLVTLKRLASVQEQRLPCANSTTPDGRLSPPVDDTPPITPTSGQHGKPIPVPAARPIVAPGGVGGDTDSIESGQQQQQRPENALDALLDELQTFSRPTVDPVRKSSGEPHALSVATGGLRRLHSYPSGSDTDNSPPLQPAPRGAASKPPLPERSAELMHALAGRRAPPPPPPRTSSRSPLASPTSPGADVSGPRRGAPGRGSVRERAHSALDQGTEPPAPGALSASSSCESVNSQEGARRTAAGGGSRQEQLEMRHQELLRKQRALQEQYARLQQLQRGSGGALTVVPPAPDLLLKKTGSESNLLQKMGLSMSAPPFTGSLTHLAKSSDPSVCDADLSITVDEGGRNSDTVSSKSDATGASTTSKVYETDIL